MQAPATDLVAPLTDLERQLLEAKLQVRTEEDALAAQRRELTRRAARLRERLRQLTQAALYVQHGMGLQFVELTADPREALRKFAATRGPIFFTE